MSLAADALGLPPDADARAIRRAYAARLKTTRPDDDPAAFQQLYETYQAALAWAEAEAATLPHRTSAAFEDMDPDTSPAPHAAAAPLPGQAQARTPPRPLASVVQDPALEAELGQWQNDGHVQDQAERILAAADAMSAAAFGPWLRALPELWSLELRPRIGHALATRAAADGVTLPDPAFDALVATFSDEEDSEFRHALWTGRVIGVALGQSPDFLAHWLARKLTPLSYDEHAALAARVLRALREWRGPLQLETVETLSTAFRWNQVDHDRGDRAWLHDTHKALQAQERVRRRLAALTPGGDAGVLAYELEVAHWGRMTPHFAAGLRERVVGPPSRWDCFLSALLPPRPTWMYRFCNTVDQWFPDGLPASLQPRHVRFWTQIGNPHRPHGWQLAVALTRGLAVAALIAVGAGLMLPFLGAAGTSWIFGVLGVGLAIWSALVLVQMAARWQARTTLASRGKRIAHRWALPAASIVLLVGMRSGAWGTMVSAALAYVAACRMLGRLEDGESRKAIVPGLTVVGLLGALLVLAAQAGAWPGTVFALLLWAISLIQSAQRQALQAHR